MGRTRPSTMGIENWPCARYHRQVDETLERIASSYCRFAKHEAHGRSLLYENLASARSCSRPIHPCLSFHTTSIEAAAEFVVRSHAIRMRYAEHLEGVSRVAG